VPLGESGYRLTGTLQQNLKALLKNKLNTWQYVASSNDGVKIPF
jgi:hypothetical protein